MAKFQPGDYVIVDADEVIQTMWRVPKSFEALVIEKMTPDSTEEFYSVFYNGKLLVAPGVRLISRSFNTHTGE